MIDRFCEIGRVVRRDGTGGRVGMVMDGERREKGEHVCSRAFV